METIRERILAALAVRLGAQRANSHIDSLPARSLWDSSDASAERNNYGQMEIITTVTLETVHQANADPQQWSVQGNAILGQLIADATGGDVTLGGLCDDIVYTGGTIYYPDDGSDILGCDINLSVTYRFDVGNPYANSM